ncbi:MAG TPA: endoglucanase, partial [Actinoplanes sp.]|nr:endoglucanase [Actinoplanes sp.]
MSRRTRAMFALVLSALLLGGCSADPPAPSPTPSPDLSRAPQPVAVNAGPFDAGPVGAPGDGAYLGAWIKPVELTHPGRVAAVGVVEQDLGRRLDIINTYRRFEQPVGTKSDHEFL